MSARRLALLFVFALATAAGLWFVLQLADSYFRIFSLIEVLP